MLLYAAEKHGLNNKLKGHNNNDDTTKKDKKKKAKNVKKRMKIANKTTLGRRCCLLHIFNHLCDMFAPKLSENIKIML
jgi:hypothetical protein